MAKVDNFAAFSSQGDERPAMVEGVIEDDKNGLYRKLSKKLSRNLWLMKLIGAYCGDAALEKDTQSSHSTLLSGLYCTIVLLGQRSLVFVVLTNHSVEGLGYLPRFYLLLIYLPPALDRVRL